MLSHSVMSKSLRPLGLQPARLHYPWGFSRQEYWSGLPLPSPEYLLNPGIKLQSCALQADSLPAEPLGKLSVPQCYSIISWPSENGLYLEPIFLFSYGISDFATVRFSQKLNVSSLKFSLAPLLLETLLFSSSQASELCYILFRSMLAQTSEFIPQIQTQDQKCLMYLQMKVSRNRVYDRSPGWTCLRCR